ncbi:AMP-binding protein [Goodfellowiella coeruleoviolacea]|nr:AMP-binding protein [Goodfellowiella coeruleoviolacea]
MSGRGADRSWSAAALGLVDRVALPLHAGYTLWRAGVLRPMRPTALRAVLAGWRHWQLTLPFGYLVGAARHPDRPAIVDELGSLSYAQVAERTARLAAGFAGMGVRAGDTVAVLCRNHRGLVEAAVATARLGAHTALLNTGLSATQVAAVLREQDASLVVADAEFRPLLRTAPRKARRVIAWQDGPTRSTTLAELIAAAPAGPPPRPDRHGRLVVLTSGTTGTPKGARRPHPRGLSAPAALLSRIPLRHGRPLLVAAPLFHTWGLAGLQLGLVLGATLVLRRRFDAERLLADIAGHRVDSVFAVPVMLQRVLELPHEIRHAHDVSSLRVVACSGSALPAPVAADFQRRFGPVLYNVYGSTEVSWVSVATPAELRAAPHTAGRPPVGTRVRLLDEHGRPVPAGQPGRIFVANSMLFEGYTDGAAKEVRQGLMATGDVGRLEPSGLLAVVGRDDEMIISGGENVYPREVEDVIAGLPGVREAAVLGVPDERYGQRLAAYVVRADGAELDADAVRGHVRERLARFCVPRDVVFLDALPRNATGKVLKRALGTD